MKLKPRYWQGRCRNCGIALEGNVLVPVWYPDERTVYLIHHKCYHKTLGQAWFSAVTDEDYAVEAVTRRLTENDP